MNDDEIKQLLKEILKWQRLQAVNVALELLPKILDTKEKKVVYEMADGKNGIKEVQAKVKIATGTIHKWWNDWLAQGILEKKGQKYQKIISLKQITIEIAVPKEEK
jgi:transposase